MTVALSKTGLMLLQRVAQAPVSFTFAPNVRGKSVKLVRSSISQSQQAALSDLAVLGFLARVVTGSAPHFPLETTVTYSLTSLGREALGMHAERKPTIHRDVSLTDEQLEREGCK